MTFKLLYLCQQPAVTWSHAGYDSLTGVQLQPGVSVLVDSIWGIMFINNLNFTGWLNSAKLSWASSRVRCLNSQYANNLRTISVPVTWKTEYYMGCHSTSYMYLAEPLSHSCSGPKWGWWVESGTQPVWSSILINILVTGYQAQINMKSWSRFKVISV